MRINLFIMIILCGYGGVNLYLSVSTAKRLTTEKLTQTGKITVGFVPSYLQSLADNKTEGMARYKNLNDALDAVATGADQKLARSLSILASNLAESDSNEKISIIEYIYVYKPVYLEGELRRELAKSTPKDARKSLDLIAAYNKLGAAEARGKIANLQGQSQLFQIWSAASKGSQPKLEDIFRHFTSGKKPERIDLGGEIVFRVVMDTEYAKYERPGGWYYGVPNDKMEQMARLALKGRTGEVSENEPTNPEMTSATEVPTMSTYRSIKIGDHFYLIGTDINAVAYYTEMRKAARESITQSAITLLIILLLGILGAHWLFVKPIRDMEIVVKRIKEGELDVDTRKIEIHSRRHDELGDLARTLVQLVFVHKEIIGAMIDPRELRKVLKNWDDQKKLFGLKNPPTTVMFTDLQNSTVLSQILKGEDFDCLTRLLNLITQCSLTNYGLRPYAVPGDGEIVAEENQEHEGLPTTARMLLAAIEAYREDFAVNYVLQKLGLKSTRKRFGIHFGTSVRSGLLNFDNSPAAFNSNPIANRVYRLLSLNPALKLQSREKRNKCIVNAMSGETMNIGSRYEPASKNWTGMTISPEELKEILPYQHLFPGLRIAAEPRVSKEGKNEIVLFDLFPIVDDLKEGIDNIFAEGANKAVIEDVKTEFMSSSPELALSRRDELEKDLEGELAKPTSHQDESRIEMLHAAIRYEEELFARNTKAERLTKENLTGLATKSLSEISL